MRSPERISVRSVFEGHAIRVTVEEVLSEGGQRRTMDVVRHPGAAAVVAVDADGAVRMVRQWRQPLAALLLEIPAGRVDPGEARAEAAARELAEEVGVAAGRWTDLGEVVTSPGFCDEAVSLYLAEDLREVGLSPDPGEELEQVRVPFAEAHARALAGDLRDAKTVVALLRAGARLAGRARARGAT